MFISKRTSVTEENYSNSERELAAIVWAFNRLEFIISGSSIKIETDHQPLISIIKRDSKKL